jgi:hypothetical protein
MAFGNQPLLISKDPNICNQKVATLTASLLGIGLTGRFRRLSRSMEADDAAPDERLFEPNRGFFQDFLGIL